MKGLQAMYWKVFGVPSESLIAPASTGTGRCWVHIVPAIGKSYTSHATYY